MSGRDAMNEKLIYRITLLLGLLLGSSALYARDVGRIQYRHGTVSLQEMNGSNARIAAANENFGLGEVVKTGPGSFAVIRLHDGTLITARPETSFMVERYKASKNTVSRVVLRLYRGGLRAVTGSGGSKTQGEYTLLTPVSMLSIQDAVFDIRLCEDDCEEENNRIKALYEKQLEATVARPVYVHGSLVARSGNGKSRVLKSGSAVFEGDTLLTGASSYAILVFRDNSRISLQANTVFRIDEMQYDSKSEENSATSFSLLRGGLRTLSGMQYPQKYRMHTALTDIGINGTGYDLVCTGPCEATDTTRLRPLRLQEGDGLYAHVWQGAIRFGALSLPAGKAAYLSDRDRQPVMLPAVPAFLQKNTVPRPDQLKLDDTGLFRPITRTAAPHGLYVSVSSGVVRVTTKIDLVVELGKGQASYTDALGRQVKQLARIPEFQRYDRYPTPDTPDPEVSPLSRSIRDGGSGTVCEIR